MKKINLLVELLLIALMIFPSACFAFMSAGQYTIFADTIEAGGSFSSEGNNTLEDTIGESGIGYSIHEGKNFIINAGYQAMDNDSFELNFNTTTINLGNLVVGTVASSSVIITITTTAQSGYVMRLSGGLTTPLTPVSDGEVTAGQEEYGAAVLGIDAAFADDRSLQTTSAFTIASSSTPVSGARTELIFKASINDATSAGDRHHDVDLYVVSNF